MATLSDLRPNILDLSPKDALNLIIAIRANRRVSKRPIVVSQKTKTKKQNVANLDCSKFTHEQISLLLTLIETEGS